MRMFKPGNKRAKLSYRQRAVLKKTPKSARRALKRKMLKEAGDRRASAYCVAKLKSQGLWQNENNKSKLTVIKVKDGSGLTVQVP